MHSAQTAAIGYAGNALGHALKMLPHIESLGFDGEHFMKMVMADMQGLGIMRDGAITGGQETAIHSNISPSPTQNTGRGGNSLA